MDILEKIETALEDKYEEETKSERLEWDEKMIDLVLDLYDLLPEDVELPENISILLDELFSEFEDEDDFFDELDEALRPVKDRHDPKERRVHHKYYRRNKAKIKRTQKKYRKSAYGKKVARKRERMDIKGKTTTGKRKKYYTNN